MIDTIDRTHDTTLFTSLDWEVSKLEKAMDDIAPGISWSPMSWHAVVPMADMGFPEDDIKRFVMIPEHIETDELKGQLVLASEYLAVPETNALTLMPDGFSDDPDITITRGYMDSASKIINFYDHYKTYGHTIDARLLPPPSQLC